MTFDNWHSVGYGDEVVVIYETAKGSLVKKLGLSDFLTEGDIGILPASVSSINWGGDHSIDAEKNELHLKVTKARSISEEKAGYFIVRIELSTGKVLDEKRDRLPHTQYIIAPLEPGLQETDNGNLSNCGASAEYKKLSSPVFLKEAISQVSPVYTPAAKAVRVSGKIVVGVLVGENGDVECAETISGHPLLKKAVSETVKKWKFKKSETKYWGIITFEAKVALVSPDGTIIE